MIERVARMQAAVREEGCAGWLLFDFHGTNPIARRILGLAIGLHAPKTTRRWFYLVPADGEPLKLVHRLEPHALDHLPGRAIVYLTWQDLRRGTEALVRSLGSGSPAVAMEYSEEAKLPYVSRVDAGTVELIRAAGVRVVSSADLAQRFDGALSPEARLDHRQTGVALQKIITEAFRHARAHARDRKPLTELLLQRWILDRFEEAGLTSSDPPTVAVNEHSGDAHFANTPALDSPIRAGDFLLLDVWAKRTFPGAVYADYTQVAYLGASAPERHRQIFSIVKDARDRAIAYVRGELREERIPRGCDVDDVAREVIRSRGYGDRFIHRTGHSIGEEVHGNGVHLDNLETRDERKLVDGALVSVEPGIYLEEFGIRSEVNLLIDGAEAVVTPDPPQSEILLLHV